MKELLEWMEYIEDARQQTKVRHTLKDIPVIVLFATLANADDWVRQTHCVSAGFQRDTASGLFLKHRWYGSPLS